MNTVSLKIEIYNRLLPDLSIYINNVRRTFKLLYSLVTKLQDNIKSIEQSISELQDIKGTELTDIFSTVHHINIIDEYLDIIYNSLANDTIDASTDMSNSYLLDMNKEFADLTLKYNILSKENKKHTDSIIEESLKITSTHGLIEIKALFERFPQAIILYTSYLQNILYNNPDTLQYRQAVIALEDAKHFIFSGENDPVNHPLLRYGLMPRYVHLNVNELTEKLLNVLNNRDKKTRRGGGSELDKLSELCKARRYGLFVMTMILPKPYMFKFDQLFNRQNEEVVKYEGISEKSLIKHSTIIKLDTDKKTPIFENTSMGDIESNNWFVIRTLDGTHYDIMASGSIISKRREIEKLKLGHSSVIDNYQTLCNKLFMQHTVQPRIILPTEKIGHLHTISNNVIRNLINHIDKIITRTPPTSLSDIYHIINSSELNDIILNDIIKLYNAMDIESKELSITFLCHASKITSELVKNIRIMVSRSSIKEVLFREKITSVIVPSILTIMRDIIVKTTEKILTDNNDIYEKIIIKKNMLKI